MATDEGYEETGNHAIVTGLLALRWTLQDDARSERLLALTGLSAAELRASASDPATLAGLLRFLEGHEPDLIACAAELGVNPGELVRARALLDSLPI